MRRIKMVVAMSLVLPMATGAAAAQQMVNAAVTEIPGVSLQANAAANGIGKAKDDLLAGTEKFAQGASRVTEINLDPTTMSMIGQQYGPDAKLAGKMKLMVVRDYAYDKPGMFRMEDVEAYVKKLEDGSWSCPVVSREKDNLSYICAKTDSDHETNEMVILAAAPQKLSFIHIAGTLSFNDLSQMSGSAKSLGRRVAPSDSPRVFVLPKGPVQFTPTLPPPMTSPQ